jgi:AcrR family transcriptional regulator
MSHEVIKRIGRRAYRYRVESRRDPETGRAKPRWIYLGVAGTTGESGAEAAPLPEIKRTPSNARVRLLDALERIGQVTPYAAITAGAVAAEAGVAHGTFYRYFPDKRALFASAFDHLREDFARSSLSFRPPYGDRAAERARVRGWLQAILAKPAAHPGLFRLFYAAIETDAEFRAGREERRRERVAELSAYLEELVANGTITALRAGAASVALALMTLVEATFRAAIVSPDAGIAAAAAGTIEVVDRAIFGPEATSDPSTGSDVATATAAAGTSAIETRSPVS